MRTCKVTTFHNVNSAAKLALHALMHTWKTRLVRVNKNSSGSWWVGTFSFDLEWLKPEKKFDSTVVKVHCTVAHIATNCIINCSSNLVRKADVLYCTVSYAAIKTGNSHKDILFYYYGMMDDEMVCGKLRTEKILGLRVQQYSKKWKESRVQPV